MSGQYLVLRLDGSVPHCPKVKHLSCAAAAEEAERLAEKHQGCTFVVCEILTAYRTAPKVHQIALSDLPLIVRPVEEPS